MIATNRETLMSMLEDRLLEGTGEKVIVGEAAMDQIKLLTEGLCKRMRYNKNAFSADQYAALSLFLDTLSWKQTDQEIIDGVMQPVSEEYFQARLSELGAVQLHVPEEVQLTMLMLDIQTELLDKHRHFYLTH